MKWLVYVPVVVAILKEAIEAAEVQGYGPEKKAAVLDIVKVALVGFGAPDVEKLVGIAGSIIDILTALYNLVGKFKKTTAPAQ
jgi:hypothetical protein